MPVPEARLAVLADHDGAVDSYGVELWAFRSPGQRIPSRHASQRCSPTLGSAAVSLGIYSTIRAVDPVTSAKIIVTSGILRRPAADP